MKKLLLIGAGPSNLEALRQFGGAQPDSAYLTIVNPLHLSPCHGMLPGLVAGHYAHAQCHVDLDPLARKAGAKLVLKRVIALDPDARTVTLESGAPLEFDVASIDIGSIPLIPDVPGLRDYALLARPAEIFLQGWERIVELASDGALRRFTVAGGEASGVELMLAMQHRLMNALAAEAFERCGFSIVTGAACLLANGPAELSRAAERVCAQRGISLLRGAPVTAIERDAIQLANGARLASDVTIWAVGEQAPRWLSGSGLACDEGGFMQVGDTLLSTSHGSVFGCGDCVSALPRPRPRPATAAQGALHGAVLARNLRHALAAGSLESVPPAGTSLTVLGLGGRQALALRGGHAPAWPRWLVWRWKDRLERRWVRRYSV